MNSLSSVSARRDDEQCQQHEIVSWRYSKYQGLKCLILASLPGVLRYKMTNRLIENVWGNCPTLVNVVKFLLLGDMPSQLAPRLEKEGNFGHREYQQAYKNMAEACISFKLLVKFSL